MPSGDDFDTQVRAPLWYAIYDAFGEEYHDHVTGDSGWGDEYWELEKRLKRRLGRWELAEHLHAGDAIQFFLKTAPRDYIVVAIHETLDLAKEVLKPGKELEQLEARLAAIREIADESPATPSRGLYEPWYDTAQVCLNGHIINRQVDSHPEASTKFCKECGAATIKRCRHCDTLIRGYKHIPNHPYEDDSPPPRFCHECGRPHPWMESQRAAAEAQIAELEGLTDAEKTFLSSGIDDIIRDTPRTETAVLRIKKLLPKAGREGAEVLRRLLVGMATEAAKRLLSGG